MTPVPPVPEKNIRQLRIHDLHLSTHIHTKHIKMFKICKFRSVSLDG